jgi:ubiquitin-conjugating enzyme E2 Z
MTTQINSLDNQSPQIQVSISKETAQRLLKDVRSIIKNPLTDNGIYYQHDENNMLKGYALIVGPSDTPYFGGYYFFKFDYPTDYPFSPPTVTFMTNNGRTRFNPNLYKCGKVCVSILNTWSGEKWSSCQTISSILLVLCSLLNAEPFLNEPGQSKTSIDFNNYTKSIEYANIDYAICDIINLENNKIPSPFKQFYPFMEKHFLLNYNKLLEFINKKQITNLAPTSISVNLYLMNTSINYSSLKEKLINTKKIIESQSKF